MPIYVYECPHCKHKEEIILFNLKLRNARRKCSKCGKTIKRIMAVPGPTWKFLDTVSK